MSVVCRTCLRCSRNVVSLFAVYGGRYRVTDMLAGLLTIKFDAEDGLPSDICIPCADNIIKSYTFKEVCKKSNDILKSYLDTGHLDEFIRNKISVIEDFQKKNMDIDISKKDDLCQSNDIIAVQNELFFSCQDNASLEETKMQGNIMDINKSKIDNDSCDTEMSNMYKSCSYSSVLKTEYVKHKRKMHKCMKIIKSRSHRNTKKPHIRIMEDRNKLYKCTYCDYKSETKSKLSLHTKIHIVEKPYCCNFCSFKTNFKTSLQTHLRVHTGEKPFLCDECDYRFKQLAHLKQHKLTHSHNRPWACNVCSYKAKAKRHLDNHLRTHTGEKPFMCDLCSFTCANHVNLVSHKRSHNDIKVFKCDHCNYSSNFKKNLSMHIAKHSGIKPFSCHLCEYKGTCTQNLKAHMISHSQDKPFSCTDCTYKTKTRSRLNKHIKIHVK